MRKPLVCMRGFRGRGWGDRGGGPDPPCENSNNNFTYFYFFFFTKNSPRTPPHPLGQTIIIILGKWIHVPHEYEVHTVMYLPSTLIQLYWLRWGCQFVLWVLITSPLFFWWPCGYLCGLRSYSMWMFENH